MKCNVNVDLYSAKSHSASNALNAPDIVETETSKLRQKVALWRSGFHSLSDNEFQVAGSATAKAQ